MSDLVQFPGVIDEVGGFGADGVIVCRGYIGYDHYGLILTPVPPSPADITNDCRVNVSDLLFVINEWGKPKSVADINGDGFVNVVDLLLVIQYWDTP